MNEILAKHIPVPAFDYCLSLWEKYKFSFKVSKTRNTCLGNYSYRSNRGHLITINNDLNIYSFLITYLHEVAHLIAFQNAEQRFFLGLIKRRKKIIPHGKEWQNAFRTLLQPILNTVILPNDILKPLLVYSEKPKASSTSDKNLWTALKNYDEKQAAGITLDSLPIGATFKLKNRIFKTLEKRRTRIFCVDLKNKKNYLVAGLAEVIVVE